MRRVIGKAEEYGRVRRCGAYGGTIARQEVSANPSFENALVIDRLIGDGLLQPGPFFNTYVLTPKARKATRGPRTVAQNKTT
jgi:hypothetical protein